MGEDCRRGVFPGKGKSSLWDMLEVRLLIVGYIGLLGEVGAVKVLRVISLCVVFWNHRVRGDHFGSECRQESKGVWG